MVSFVVVVEEKVESRKEEMVDLQRVDWIMEGICGFGLGGSVSEMGWWNWLLGLLHFFCSPIDEASAASTGMVSIHSVSLRERKSLCFSCLWDGFERVKKGIMDYGKREEVIKAFRVRDRETEGREEVIFEFSGEKRIVFCWLVFHLFFYFSI